MQRREDRGPRRPLRRDGGGFRPRFGRDRGFTSGPPSVDYGALVEFVAKTVAEKPEEVEVKVMDRPRGGIAVKVKMAEDDMGKLIGRGGRNIEALRALVRTAALRDRRRVFLDVG